MDIRMAVLRHVAGGGDTRFHERTVVATLQQRLRCTREQVWEALWALVGEGLIYRDPANQGSGNTDNWRWRASDLGRQVAAGGNWEPRDPDGYLRRLRSSRPPVDEKALVYVERSPASLPGPLLPRDIGDAWCSNRKCFNGLAEAFVIANPAIPAPLMHSGATPAAPGRSGTARPQGRDRSGIHHRSGTGGVWTGSAHSTRLPLPAPYTLSASGSASRQPASSSSCCTQARASYR
jgi:hypothetical protein